MIKYILVSVMLLCSTLSKADDLSTWRCRFGPFGTYSYIGTSPSASDGLDSLDTQLGYSNYIYMSTYHEQGVDGWADTNGFYGSDIRSPLEMTPGSTKTWRIYYWNNSNSPSNWTDSDLTWHFESTDTQSVLNNVKFTLTFVRLPVGMDVWNPPSYASPDLGQTVVLNDHKEGNWVLSSYRTENGLDGYVFDITATVVPEPSSMLALFGGMTALGGFALKRKGIRKTE